MSRFDYIEFDGKAKAQQQMAKALNSSIELMILEIGSDVYNPEIERAKSLALVKLEESFMWIGKAIRNAQILRDKRPVREPRGDEAISKPQAFEKSHDFEKRS